ncbi:MAG: transporter [Clostridiaceae bacterium]
MKENIKHIFQVAAVFIGTIVGAGLASGREITQFFTVYGVKSFIGIILCGLFYIIMGSLISKIGLDYGLSSYSDVIKKVSPNILGSFTGIFTTLYLLSSSSIILAGSGALLNQFFKIPKIVGTLIMILLALAVLLRNTKGLIEINSVIVPSLIIIIITIMLLYVLFYRNYLNFETLSSFPAQKDHWFLSTILYSGYNILCSSGVLISLGKEFKKKSTLFWGIVFGAAGLTFICFLINIMLMLNQPYIYKYEIPLLYITDRFGTALKGILLAVIFMEMFSTEVSDVYSISKTLEQALHIPFKLGIFLIIFLALPISQIGFSNLICTLYPIFGMLSLIFIIQCLTFYIRRYVLK